MKFKKHYSLKEAYLDKEEKFYDYKTGTVNGDDIFDKHKTGFSYYDNFLNKEDAKYMEKTRNLVGGILYMTPNEYFKECASIFGKSVENQIDQTKADTETIEHLKEVINKYKRKFPLPYLNVATKQQEGRHRMYVAGELFGWDTRFPVLVVQDKGNIRVKTEPLFEDKNDDAVEYDSEGNPLTKEQVEFFKDSKVRNKKGQLVVCYHSTDADFDVFNIKRSGLSGNLFDDGFYFSTHSDNIYAYGSKYKVCYLNITKPYNVTEDSNNENLAKELIKNYCGELDEEFYNKVAKDGKDHSLGIESNVLRYIQLKTNKSTTFTKVLKVSNFDGVVADNLGDIESVYTEIIAFYPNQIKSIGNKNPTNSSNINEEILFEDLPVDSSWDYRAITKEIVNNLEELDYWDQTILFPYVYTDYWEGEVKGCDIEATYYNEEDVECAWLQIRIYEYQQAITFRQIDVYEDGGMQKTGLGKELVRSVLEALPKGTKILVHLDISGGFWRHMSQSFKDYDWDKSLHEESSKEKKVSNSNEE